MSGPVPDAVPVLPVSDLARAIAFYERLGFDERVSYDQYAILGYGTSELHLQEAAVNARDNQSGVYLRVADADSVHAHWQAMGAPTLRPPTDEPYGMREFATQDPDGNLWRVASPLAAEPPSPEPPAATPTSIPAPQPDPGDDVDWFQLVADGARCEQCGLPNGELHPRAIGAEIRDLAHAFGQVLTDADDDLVRTHPGPNRWSALEYGVHVRDMLTVFAERIVRAKAEPDPELAAWDHEEPIADGMANESDVAAVADDMGRNASKLSEALRLVTEDDWERPATCVGHSYTIELLARYALHDIVHHRHDVDATLDELR